MKAVEKQRREYDEAKAAYDQRMLDFGLNVDPFQQPHLGKPIFMQEPRPGAILQQTEAAEAKIRNDNQALLERQAMRLRTFMGPGFDEEARNYETRLEAWASSGK